MRISNFPLYMKTKQNVVIGESVNTHSASDISELGQYLHTEWCHLQVIDNSIN